MAWVLENFIEPIWQTSFIMCGLSNSWVICMRKVWRNLNGFYFIFKSQFFFERVAMPAPTKSQNSTSLDQGSPSSTQLSHSSRFCHLRPLFGDNGYPPCKSTTQNQNLFLLKDFNFLPTQAKKIPLLQLGIHGDPAKRDLRKIMGKIRYHYFQNWHLKIV